MVVNMLSSGGVDQTPIWQRIYWAALMGLVAVVLLLAGGLSALQTMAIASALPFAVVVLVACYGLFRALQLDLHKKDSQHAANLAPRVARNPVSWEQRVHNAMELPHRSDVDRYILEVVEPAMQDMAVELRKQQMAVAVIQGEQAQGIRLQVTLGDEMNFEYEVRARAYLRPAFNLGKIPEDEDSKYFRAEVHLREGGQDYDVMSWSREQILADIIDQYEKHLHFLHVVRE